MGEPPPTGYLVAMKLAPQPYVEGRVCLPDGRHLGFAEYGNPHGDPVLWFHGTPGARKQIPPGAPDAAEQRGQRIIALERPGVGLSTHDRKRSLLSWADDVRALCDSLDLDRISVVGLSGGGPHVLACAHAMPERVVAACVLGGLAPITGDEAAGGFLDGGLIRYGLAVMPYIREPLGLALTWLVKGLRPVGGPVFELYARLAPASDRPVFADPAFKEMFIGDLSDSARRGLRSITSDAHAFIRPWDFSLRDIRVPVKIWHGTADGLVPLSHGEHMAALIPGAELVTVPDEGHFAGFVRFTEVLDFCARGFEVAEPAPATKAATKG